VTRCAPPNLSETPKTPEAPQPCREYPDSLEEFPSPGIRTIDTAAFRARRSGVRLRYNDTRLGEERKIRLLSNRAGIQQSLDSRECRPRPDETGLDASWRSRSSYDSQSVRSCLAFSTTSYLPHGDTF